MKNLILISISLLGLLVTVSSCKNEQPATSTNEILLVKYHADWCGSCRALSPLLKELNGKLAGKKVKYVELDFTNEVTSKAAGKEATELGLAEYLTEKQKTGYVAIVDAKTKKELGKLTKTQSVNEMYEKVISNL